MRRSGHGLALVGLGILVACGPSPEEVKELTEQQKAILGKITDMDKKLTDLAKAPAAAAPAAADDNRVFDLPVGGSPFRGSADAKVAIVEFSDFQ
jgi:protein-disulfide isomerase